MKKEIYHIALKKNTNILISNTDDKLGKILLCGFTDGLFGGNDENFGGFVFDEKIGENNLQLLLDTLKKGYEVWVIGDLKTLKYAESVIKFFVESGLLKARIAQKLFKGINCGKFTDEESYSTAIANTFDKFYNSAKKCNMKFDGIIQNPPYDHSTHLDFLEKGLDLLDDKGYMTIIEPATWLINIRKNGRAKRYDEIKKKLDKHIKSVVIENLNKEFNTGLYVPFATTTIDMSKEYDTIDCNICGEHRTISNIYDCNLVGNYNTIWSILNKVQKYGNMMNKHITKEDKGREYWYAKYQEIIPVVGCLMNSPFTGSDEIVMFNSNTNWKKVNKNEYLTGYLTTNYHTGEDNQISLTPHKSKKPGASKEYKNTIADNIYDTKEHLENWKHFIFNNKLPLFINIVMTIDQHNNSKEFLPWLVDKQYTDEEINKMFDFTDDEIKLIDRTLKKYERNSPWFKRYMCGAESVSDEEVNNFIAELNKNA